MAVNSNDEAYRKEQAEYFANNDGTTARETLLLLMPSVCSLFLMITTRILIGKRLNIIVKYALEFFVVIFPTILTCTVYSDSKISFSFALLILSFTNLALIFVKNVPRDISASKTVETTRRPFITNFRSLTSVLTAICILAVDFKAFPKRYAKTESHGYSLMDTGVGFFVMANALVSKEARDFSQRNEKNLIKSLIKNILDSLRSCIPLLVLGSARYFSVEYFDYQRQVTEYGVHWNFFVTLAAVKIITTTLGTFVESRRSLILGIIILVSYECVLNTVKFRKWFFSNSRIGFINANKEGIVSATGYVGLYFVGVAIGRLIHSTYMRVNEKGDENRPNSFRLFYLQAEYTDSMILCVKLSLISAQTCLATIFIDGYFGVSRKFANSGYCAWMITLSSVMLTLLLLLDIVADILAKFFNGDNKNADTDVSEILNESPHGEENIHRLSSVPEILQAVNYNGLAFFLISNLLTGAVNMSMRTLHVDDINAVRIIVGYMLVDTGFFYVLHRLKIQIKL